MPLATVRRLADKHEGSPPPEVARRRCSSLLRSHSQARARRPEDHPFRFEDLQPPVQEALLHLERAEPANGEVYEFGSCTLDVGERRLWNAGHVVPLAPKAYDVLVALVRRAGTLTKHELLDVVWGDVAVKEGVLSVYVSALRSYLN